MNKGLQNSHIDIIKSRMQCAITEIEKLGGVSPVESQTKDSLQHTQVEEKEAETDEKFI